MKKGVLGKIAMGLAGAAVVLTAVVATRPSTFHYERSITVAAPPETVFAQVNDFHAWTGWSPYEKLDPQIKRSYAGPASGVGASYAWSGNQQVGEGRMTIERSDAASQIAIKLEFVKPLAATNMAKFTFAKTADGTKVTWAMDGENGFISKAASLVFDLEKLVGDDFERGLAALKTQAETAARAQAQADDHPR